MHSTATLANHMQKSERDRQRALTNVFRLLPSSPQNSISEPLKATERTGPMSSTEPNDAIGGFERELRASQSLTTESAPPEASSEQPSLPPASQRCMPNCHSRYGHLTDIAEYDVLRYARRTLCALGCNRCNIPPQATALIFSEWTTSLLPITLPCSPSSSLRHSHGA